MRRAVLGAVLIGLLAGCTSPDHVLIEEKDHMNPAAPADTVGTVYTHAMWKVKPGREKDFVEAWDDLAEIFSGLMEPPVRGTLIQSTVDSTLFYSFGPWRSMDHVRAMREDPAVQTGLARLADICEEATPAAYEVVRVVVVEEESE